MRRRTLDVKAQKAGQTHPSWTERQALNTEARARNPARWARHARDWERMGPVTLNLERDAVVAQHLAEKLTQPLAA